ncbi:glycosyltransferase [Desulfobacterales bacterium]|nr:glycosyltransferase [Desulfobacterales bacterium]
MKIVFVGNLGSSVVSVPNGQSQKTIEWRNCLEALGHKLFIVDTSLALSSWIRLLLIFKHDTYFLLIPGKNSLCFFSLAIIVHKLISGSSSETIIVAVGGWLPKTLLHNYFLRFVVGLCDAVYVQSIRAQMELKLLGVNSFVCPNTRDLQPVTTRSFSYRPLKLLFFSRVRFDKGIADAVSVHESIQAQGINSSLSVVGPMFKSESHLIDPLLTKPNISYLGVINGSQSILDLMTAHDFLLFPSTYLGESIPGAIVEALFAGLPCIAKDWIDVPEIIDHDKTGYFFPPHSYIKDSVNLLLNISPSDLQRLSSNCLIKASSFTSESLSRTVKAYSFHRLQ